MRARRCFVKQIIREKIELSRKRSHGNEQRIKFSSSKLSRVKSSRRIDLIVSWRTEKSFANFENGYQSPAGKSTGRRMIRRIMFEVLDAKTRSPSDVTQCKTKSHLRSNLCRYPGNIEATPVSFSREARLENLVIRRTECRDRIVGAYSSRRQLILPIVELRRLDEPRNCPGFSRTAFSAPIPPEESGCRNKDFGARQQIRDRVKHERACISRTAEHLICNIPPASFDSDSIGHDRRAARSFWCSGKPPRAPPNRFVRGDR